MAYNSAKTITDALRSVASQTHADVEHIVIDGGSTDATCRLVREHGAHVAALVSEPDAGIYDAMNKGLALATGAVVAFLNSDDCYADAGVLLRVADALEQDQGIDAILGDVEFFDPARPRRAVRRYRSGRFRPGRLAWGWMPAHPALFVRRAVFEKFGPFRTDYRIAGDYEWVVRAFAGGTLRSRHLDDVLVRMRTGGVSTGGWRSTLLLNQEVVRACRENGVQTNWLKILSKYPAKMMEFVR